MNFLDSYIQQAIDEGASEYKRSNPNIGRGNSGWTAGITNSVGGQPSASSSGSLNFGPYEAPNSRVYKMSERESVEQNKNV